MPDWDDTDAPGAPAPAERTVAELQRIARYQRWIVSVVLAQLALWGGVLLLALLGNRFAESPRFAVVLTFILGGVGAIYVFMLCWELNRGGVVALMFGAATVVPLMGLLVLTLVNGYATTELRKNGVRVGVFGASQADIAERRSPYDEDEEEGW
jgi:hypothetical protein